MKVFFVIRGLHDSGGVERVTSVLANKLAEDKYDIGIVCLQKGTPFFHINPDVKLYYLPDEKSSLFLPERFTRKDKLRNLYRREKPDIVIFVGSHRSLLNLPAAAGIPNITWEHFNARVNWHPLHKLSRKLAVKHSSRIVTLTHQDVENYKELFDAKNVVCIPNPITIENIEPSPLTEKRVLAVGRLASQKGFDLLLYAWQKTQNRRNGWKLRIVGSGRHLKDLKRQIEANDIEDSVEILPATKDILNHYKQASIYAMSSRYEGLPLVLIEAMASGLPIVSFDCQTGPAEVIQDNKTGFLVPALDVDKLAETLDKLMNNEHLRTKFSENSLKEVNRFSIDNIVSMWKDLFNDIVIESKKTRIQ